MQSQLHIQIVRLPARPGTGNAGLAQALQDIATLNMEAVVVLHAEGQVSANDLGDDSNVVKLAAGIFGNKPVIFEFGNEQSLAGVSTQTYTAAWNAVVPTLKTLDPNGCFAGPVHYQYDNSSDADYLTNFLTNAHPKPDYVDWHQYVCDTSSGNSTQFCLSALGSRLSASLASPGTGGFPSVPQVMQQTGVVRPMIITEWNYDPHTPKDNGDATFIPQFTDQALEGFAKYGVYASMQFWVNGLTPLVNGDDSLTPQGQAYATEYTKLIGNGAPLPPGATTPATATLPGAATATLPSAPIPGSTPTLPSQPVVLPTSQPDITPTLLPAPATMPLPASVANPSPQISFEDGTDGWAASNASGNHVSLVQRSTDQHLDGAYSLKVQYNSASADDYPQVVDSNEALMPQGGQTVTAYVYLASGSNARAWLFVQDKSFEWYSGGPGADVPLKTGAWSKLSFTIPASMSGTAARLGVQFYGNNATVYIDSVSWS
jgi:hypothetical protein